MSSLRGLLGRRKDLPSEAEERSPVRFRSRGLSHVLEARDRNAPWRVLDLGEADNGNLNFFASRGARYAVEGLSREIAPCRRAGSYDPECMRGIEGLLRFSPDTGFDLVVAWDLLDHLPIQGLDLVGKRLQPVCRPGALLYAIVSREAKLPLQPARCRVVDEDTIEMAHVDPTPHLPGPRYTQSQLDRHLGPFRVVRSYLLKIHAEEMILQAE